jgi:hypothetical protein
MNRCLEVLNSWAAENNRHQQVKHYVPVFLLATQQCRFQSEAQMLQKSACTKYLGVLLYNKLN